MTSHIAPKSTEMTKRLSPYVITAARSASTSWIASAISRVGNGRKETAIRSSRLSRMTLTSA